MLRRSPRITPYAGLAMDLLRDKPAGRFSAARLFRPDSIVVIGAASEVGAQVMANLRSGGFKGAVFAADAPESIAALSSAPDLAVIATPPPPDLLPALAAKGTFAAVVVCGADGLSDPARRAGVRVLGPESFGIAVPGIGLNASRAHLPPPAGRIGLVSQSASLCRTVLDWAQPNGVGFSHIVGIGRRADIGFGLVLDWLARDPGTGAILLDIRQLRDRRAFLSAARAASRLRPVVALRPGGVLADPSGAVGTRLRGGAAAGGRALRRQPRGPAGGSRNPRPRPAGSQRGAEHRHQRDQRRTDGGGCGAARRTAAARATSSTWSRKILRVWPRWQERAAAAPGVGGVLVVHAPTGEDDRATTAALAAARDATRLPLLVCAMGETTGAACRRSLAEAGMAVFATPEQAVRGFLHLVKDRRNRAAARELPSSAVLAVAPDRDAVRDVLAAMRRSGRLATMQDEALAVLSAYGMPVVPNRAVASPADAGDGGDAARLPRRGEAAPERAPRRACLRRAGARPARRRGGGCSRPAADRAPRRTGSRRERPAVAGAAPGRPLARTADPGRRRCHVRADHRLRPRRHDGGHPARRRRRPAAAEPGAGAWPDRPHARGGDAGAVPRQSAGERSRRWPRRWCGSASSSSISRRSPNWT